MALNVGQQLISRHFHFLASPPLGAKTSEAVLQFAMQSYDLLLVTFILADHIRDVVFIYLLSPSIGRAEPAPVVCQTEYVSRPAPLTGLQSLLQQ